MDVDVRERWVYIRVVMMAWRQGMKRCSCIGFRSLVSMLSALFPPFFLPPCLCRSTAISLPHNPRPLGASSPPPPPPQVSCQLAAAHTLPSMCITPPTHTHTQVNCQLAAAHTSPSMGIGFQQSGALGQVNVGEIKRVDSPAGAESPSAAGCQLHGGEIKRGENLPAGVEPSCTHCGSGASAAVADEMAPASTNSAHHEGGVGEELLGRDAIDGSSAPLKRSRTLFLRQQQSQSQQGGREKALNSTAAVVGKGVSVWGELFSWPLVHCSADTTQR